MSFYRGMTCANVTIKGDGGTPITAYTAKPEGKGPFPGVVLIHHLPGWSELYIESTRRFAHHGFMAICAKKIVTRGGETGFRKPVVVPKVGVTRNGHRNEPEHEEGSVEQAAAQ